MGRLRQLHRDRAVHAPEDRPAHAAPARAARRPTRGTLQRQLATYAGIGVTNVVVTLAVLNLLVGPARMRDGAPLFAASAAAFGVAVLNSYIWNSRFTFGSPRLWSARRFRRFVAVHILGLGVNQATFAAVAYSSPFDCTLMSR